MFWKKIEIFALFAISFGASQAYAMLTCEEVIAIVHTAVADLKKTASESNAAVASAPAPDASVKSGGAFKEFVENHLTTSSRSFLQQTKFKAFKVLEDQIPAGDVGRFALLPEDRVAFYNQTTGKLRFLNLENGKPFMEYQSSSKSDAVINLVTIGPDKVLIVRKKSLEFVNYKQQRSQTYLNISDEVSTGYVDSLANDSLIAVRMKSGAVNFFDSQSMKLVHRTKELVAAENERSHNMPEAVRMFEVKEWNMAILFDVNNRVAKVNLENFKTEVIQSKYESYPWQYRQMKVTERAIFRSLFPNKFEEFWYTSGWQDNGSSLVKPPSDAINAELKQGHFFPIKNPGENLKAVSPNGNILILNAALGSVRSIEYLDAKTTREVTFIYTPPQVPIGRGMGEDIDVQYSPDRTYVAIRNLKFDGPGISIVPIQ